MGEEGMRILVYHRAILATLAALAATPALAEAAVALDSAVYVEHLQPGNVRNLEPADRLNRGDRVVTVLNWRRTAGTGGFVLVNPLPRTIAYQASAQDSEEVSVDGGRAWGRIGGLTIGTRIATPEDVTHVRWRVPAGNSGRITYSGIVR
jgi:hypothetical protein